MSDDEADPELLELLRQTLGIGRQRSTEITSNTGVLKDAQYIYNNAIDVSIDMYGTKGAAAEIYNSMQQKGYSTETWMDNELHPRPSEGFSENDIVNFIFTMDLLNFSFWSDFSSQDRYQVEYRGRLWTGYNSLVACLRRALDEGTPITTPWYWKSRRFSDEIAKTVFRSATAEQIPLLEERIAGLREAGRILRESFPGDEDDDEAPEDVSQPSDRSAQDGGHTDSLAFDDPAGVTTADPVAQNVVLTHDTNVGPASLRQPFQQLALDEDSEYKQSLRNDVDGLIERTVQPDETNVVLSSQAIINDHPDIVSASGEPSEALLESTSQSNTTSSQQHVSDQVLCPGAQDAVPTTVPAVANDVLTSQSGTAQLPESRTGRPDYAVARLIERADKSAGKLVNLLAHHFPSFRDETQFDGRKVRLLKRAQIFVADLWAALNGIGLGEFHDIDHLTMFADYRVPQVLHSLGVLVYSPPLGYRIQNLGRIESGHSWEVQLRGCSIWAVELIKREILKAHPDAHFNAVLIDFFLYDLAKEREAQGVPTIPHHRTRSLWY